MIDAFHEGGWGMFPTLFFGALALAAAAVYAMRPERRFVPLVVSTSLLTMVSGLLGFVRGVSASFQHVTDASDRAVAMIGVGESAQNITLALIFIGVVLMAITIGALRNVRPRATAAP